MRIGSKDDPGIGFRVSEDFYGATTGHNIALNSTGTPDADVGRFGINATAIAGTSGKFEFTSSFVVHKRGFGVPGGIYGTATSHIEEIFHIKGYVPVTNDANMPLFYIQTTNMNDAVFTTHVYSQLTVSLNTYFRNKDILIISRADSATAAATGNNGSNYRCTCREIRKFGQGIIFFSGKIF